MDFKTFCESKKVSRREAEVLAEVAKGLTNKEIANILFVTEKTVKFHLTSIYRKCGWRSRSQLIVACSRHKEHVPMNEPAPPHSPEELKTGFLIPGRGGNA